LKVGALWFLVGGVAAFMALFRICDAAGLDWYFSAGLSILPIALAILFVAFLVNGQPPSYSLELFLFTVRRLIEEQRSIVKADAVTFSNWSCECRAGSGNR
jgi:hypothetical protein